MAYLSEFENDIFISYARLNNQPIEAGAEGWVSRFHSRLESELTQLTGRELKIWRDLQDLERNQLFDVTIKRAVETSALFIAINSLSWKASTYCQAEAQWFNDRAQVAQGDGWGVAIGDRKRAFNVLFNKIPYTDWNPLLSGANPYNFFEAETADDVGFPCDPESDLFKRELRALVRNLFNTLRAFKLAIENRKQPASAPPVSSNGQQTAAAKAPVTIFLAGTSDTLRRARQRLATELSEKGVALADEVPPPWEPEEHNAKALTEIQRAQLCVHLFDAWPGRELEGQTELYYTHHQFNLARQQAKAQLLCVAPSLEVEAIEDGPHREFLAQLETGTREEANYSFVREAPANLAQIVLAKLEELKRTSEPAQASATVLLETHLKDDDSTIEFRNVLRNLEIRSYINQSEDDPRKNFEILETRLRQVNQMILVFGTVNEDWIWGRLSEAMRFDVAEKRQIRFYLYYAPPRRKENNGQFKLGARTIYELDDSDIRNPQALKQLLVGNSRAPA